MRVVKHPNFKDVAWTINHVRYINKNKVIVKFWWVYPKTKQRKEMKFIFDKPDTVELKYSKWKEFVNVSI